MEMWLCIRLVSLPFYKFEMNLIDLHRRVLQNGKSFLSLPGLGSSNLCAFQVLDKFASRKSASGCSAAIFQLFCNGTLCITTFESRASGSGDTSVPSVVPHRMTSAVTFPRNATSIESFCLVDGRRILIVCSCSEMHVYKYDDATEVFDHFTTLAIESDVNSVDFIDGHFLLLGLKSGGVLIYDLCVKSKFSRSNSVSSAVSFEVTEKTADLALLRVHVIDGCEPPLSRLSISSAFVEASVQGYVATTVMPPNTERGGLSARSMDSVESQSGLLRSTVHFAVAWADGRICLCDVIELDEEDDFLELEDTSPLEIVKSRKYAWKAVKCVQTGLCLFSIVCVHLQKHVEFDIRRTVVSGDDVLCIAAARTGQTFFVSNSDYSDYRNEDGARHLERDAMPRTVCCFESSILLGAPAVSRDSASASCSASAIEAIVKSIFTSGNCVMIQSFTASKS